MNERLDPSISRRVKVELDENGKIVFSPEQAVGHPAETVDHELYQPQASDSNISAPRDVEQGDDEDDIQPQGAFESEARQINRKKKNISPKEVTPMTLRNKVDRFIAYVAIVSIGGTAGAMGVNWVATKMRYGVEIDFGRQLENIGQLPVEINKTIDNAKKAVDFMGVFGIDEATGGRDD